MAIGQYVWFGSNETFFLLPYPLCNFCIVIAKHSIGSSQAFSIPSGKTVKRASVPKTASRFSGCAQSIT
jgi:cyanate permease